MQGGSKPQPFKLKKCSICSSRFEAWNSLHKTCSPKCALELVAVNKIKKSKRELKDGREKLKTKSDHFKDTQKSFNRLIRARDYFDPCMSCRTTKDVQYAAGHYFTVGGHPELRFNEDNCHKQCNRYCNMELSGNIAAYRVNLLKKIGSERLEKLEGPHDMPHWPIIQLKLMRDEFNRRALKIEKENKDKLDYATV